MTLTAAKPVDASVDCGYTQGAALGDFIWEDRNRNGLQDSGEPGILGAVVSLIDCAGNPVTDANGAAVGPVTTPASGFYNFTNLNPGSIRSR